jgi:hypothetical protein
MMRIITRPDFDGVVCAVLLFDAENISAPVYWVEPNDMQRGLIDVQAGDIIANLPYHENCSLWFDHHYTNRIDKPFDGVFKIAPSAARIIFDHYRQNFTRDYSGLIDATDKIDSADLTLDEVLRPERYDYVLLSMTVSNHDEPDEAYWNKLVELLRHLDVKAVLNDPDVQRRCRKVVADNETYRALLEKHTRQVDHVAVSDFRSCDIAPVGNRFLVYSLFPEAYVHMRIRYDPRDKDKIVVNVGHSIFNTHCKVNVGLLLSKFGGGGHPGAGSCRFHVSNSDEYISRILDALVRNEAVDN